MMTDFEEQIRTDLHRFLHSIRRVDEKLPECPDLDEAWPGVKDAYLPDGVREFTDYPVVSLGWIMFVGMALAWYWDNDFQKLHDEGAPAIYRQLRDAEGYDTMDEYILRDILGLKGEEAEKTSNVVAEAAARVYHHMQRCLEPGTAQAVNGYIASLNQLYLMGVAMQLNAMGYHMTKMG